MQFLKFTGVFLTVSGVVLILTAILAAAACMALGFQPGSGQAGGVFLLAAIPAAYAILRGTMAAADWIITD
jgi:hypothetical protein